MITNEMIEAAKAKGRELAGNQPGALIEAFAEVAEAGATAAVALVPGEPKLYGPYGYLNGSRALSEDEWTLDNNPGENSAEYFSIPLFAKVDAFSPTPHPNLDREGLLEEAREALDKIAKAPAWGAPERWETTPAEVRQLARSVVEKIAKGSGK